MATGQGVCTFSFGAAPGTNVVTQTVTDAAIGSTSKVELYIMGTDSTAEHNSYEHTLIPLGGFFATVITINAGVGFIAQAATQLRLTGDVKCRYVWAD